MPAPLSISEAASLGLHATALLAERPETRHATAELAATMGASTAHLAKVIQRLVRAGLVRSHRGPGGGITLAKPADQIRLLEIYEAVEGPLEVVGCLLGRRLCNGHDCALGGVVQRASQELRTHLERTTLDSIGPLRKARKKRPTT